MTETTEHPVAEEPKHDTTPAPALAEQAPTPEEVALAEAAAQHAIDRHAALHDPSAITREKRDDGKTITRHAAVPTGQIVSTPHKPKPMPRVRPGSPPVAQNPALGGRISRDHRRRHGMV